MTGLKQGLNITEDREMYLASLTRVSEGCWLGQNCLMVVICSPDAKMLDVGWVEMGNRMARPI